MRVLIVEDNASDRKILKINLERNGCEVIEAADGREGLEMAGKEHPDLIISDALMPRMDGFELLREIRKDERLAGIPFIFYSAVYTSRKEEELATAMGAAAFVVKPLEPHRFWERLLDILSECSLKKQASAAAPLAGDEEFLRRYSRIVAARLEEKVRTLDLQISRMPIAHIVWDTDFLVRSWNPAATKIFGYTAAEMIGRPPLGLIVPDSFRSEAEKIWQRLLTDTKDEEILNVNENITRDGRVIVCEWHNIPLRRPDGSLREVLSMVLDVTAREKSEQKLRQAQKMEAIGTLAGGIAHDFNNILSAIIGYAELARMDIPANGQAADDIRQVLLAGKRATDLVRQILTFSRQTEQKRQPLRLQHLVKETLKLLRPSLPSTIEIRQKVDETCPTVLADPSQVHQVLMNLCTNAYQAMEDKIGVLTITLSRVVVSPEETRLVPDLPAGDYVLLTVSDTGCGMNRETLSKIFEPYFSTKKEKGGTGLGLAVVHGIVTSHGGHLSAYSEPGKGSTFKVYLPAMGENAGAQAELLTTETKPPGGTERILLVDDEESIVKLERHILSSLGYKITTASGSEEALAVFLAQPDAFDLVITDLTMPRMDGVTLAEKILAQRPELPVVLCTGFGEAATQERVQAAGIRDCLTKPVRQAELARMVRKALDQKTGTSQAG